MHDIYFKIDKIYIIADDTPIILHLYTMTVQSNMNERSNYFYIMKWAFIFSKQ